MHILVNECKIQLCLESSDKAIMMANHKGYSWFQLCNAINLKLNMVFAWFSAENVHCSLSFTIHYKFGPFLLRFKLKWYNTSSFFWRTTFSQLMWPQSHTQIDIYSQMKIYLHKKPLPANIFNMYKGQQQFMFLRAKKNVMRIKSPIRNTLALSPVKILSWRLNTKNSDEN